VAQPAYVIYTSGSTGRPKGVVVSHAGLASFSAAEIDRYDVRAGDRVLQFSSPSFDASILELCMSLPAGAALVVPPAGPLLGEQLAQVIQTHGVTHALIPPAALATVPDCELPSFRTLIVGGEACSAELVARWAGGRRMVNSYGPTEATVVSTWTEPLDPDVGTPSIGRPIANMRAYVLDAALKPCPVGVAGELYVAGVGLARGYLHRPGLTAQRFVACPYGQVPGERMYRTGDVVRWSAAGVLQFCGRADDQVKVRGFRIELGEIETVLRTHAQVRHAAVLARQDNGHKRLVAYVVGPADPAALREHLARSLPDYMIPAAFVTLDALPVNTNGKLDRDALPAPEPQAQPAGQYEPPTTKTEAILAGIWADVLGVDRVGIRDNFFALGGDSILSIQVVSRTRQAGLLMTAKDLFTHQNVAALAEVVSTIEVADTGQTADVVGEVPFTPIQRWFFDTHTANPHHFNQSTMMELADGVDTDALAAAFDALLAHHDALRMRFTRVDGHWRQHNAPVEPVSVLRHVDLSDVDTDEQPAAMEKIADDVHAGFDLSQGPLLAAVLFARGAGLCPYLLVVAHHLVVDGVSWRILMDDLEIAYQQASRGEQVKLGAKTTSFRDWARRLTEHVAAGGLDREIEHWAGARAGSPLPVDRPAAEPESPVRSVSVLLDADDTDALLRGAPSAYRTRVNDVLLGALAWALSRWTGDRRVAVQLEGHGRDDVLDGVDLSRTIGWFTTMFPIALEVPAGPGDPPDWRTLVKAVRRQLRAVPGNGYGHGALRWLGADEVRERLAAVAGPQVVFNYLGQFDSRSQDEGGALYHAALTSIGQAHDPADRPQHLIEVVGEAQGGQLGFSWYYQPDLHDEQTVAGVAADFAEALRCIAEDCR
jgi:non-ribosomal peptide synthase protein (TIGR01720 family)